MNITFSTFDVILHQDNDMLYILSRSSSTIYETNTIDGSSKILYRKNKAEFPFTNIEALSFVYEYLKLYEARFVYELDSGVDSDNTEQ